MEKVKISELKTNNTISDLVPEMTEKEYLDLKSSIEESGLRHPIDINKDYTILDGRHRVRVYEALGYESIEVVEHNLNDSEAIKFVVDTAVNRRNLTEAQRLDIVLNSEDVIAEIVENNKNRQLSGLKNQNSSLGSVEPNDNRLGSVKPKRKITSTNTGEEIGKLAGVSRSTVIRAKKVRNENPEAYQKVVKGESTWSKEYDNLPSVKNNKPKLVKEAVSSDKKMKTTIKEPVAKPKKKTKEDLRELINKQSENLTDSDKKLMRAEHEAMNIVEKSLALHTQIEEIKDLELFIRFVKTLDKDNLVKAHKSLEKLINMEDFRNE